MKRFLATGMALILATGAAAAQDRQALLIGNGSYQNAPTPQTAARDVRKVAEALRAAGWTVSASTDLDRAEMREALDRFAESAADAEDALIYYSGHALRSDGRTYLAPVDQAAGSVVEVLFDGVPLDLVMQVAGMASKEGVVFIDGAQLEGFEPTSYVEPGLGSIEAPPGVVVVSAAPPGQAIRRSPGQESRFARTIVERFLAPGAEVMATANEVGAPIWVTGKLQDALVLAPAAEPRQRGDLEQEIELAYWRTAERSGRPEDYRAYLDRYPDGVFADFAHDRLGEPGSQAGERAGQAGETQATPESQGEAAMALAPDRIFQVQQWLRATGFEPGSLDGVMGPNTRDALRDWQRAEGLPATGYLSRASLERLSRQGAEALAEQRRRQAEEQRVAEADDDGYWAATGADGTAAGYRAYLQRYPQGRHAAQARAALDRLPDAQTDQPPSDERRQYQAARRADTVGAYRAYLSAYPQGAWSDEARARLDDLEAAAGVQPQNGAQTRQSAAARTETALALNARDRQSVEQRLRSLGYEPGPIDGQLDERSRVAIESYQASRGMQPTGYLDRQTVVGIVQETNRARQGALITEGTDVVRGLIESLGGSAQGTQ